MQTVNDVLDHWKLVVLSKLPNGSRHKELQLLVCGRNSIVRQHHKIMDSYLLVSGKRVGTALPIVVKVTITFNFNNWIASHTIKKVSWYGVLCCIWGTQYLSSGVQSFIRLVAFSVMQGIHIVLKTARWNVEICRCCQDFSPRLDAQNIIKDHN